MAEHFASLAAIGDDRVGLVHDLTAFLVEQGVNVRSIRSASLGPEFALLAHFSGSDDQIAAVERGLADMERRTRLSVLFHKSKPADETSPEGTPPTHDLFVTAYDAVGIVASLTAELARYNINIDRLGGDRYPAPNQGMPLFTISASVHLPADADEGNVIAALEALRDRQGWADAELIPHKGYDPATNALPFPPPNPWKSHATS